MTHLDGPIVGRPGGNEDFVGPLNETKERSRKYKRKIPNIIAALQNQDFLAIFTNFRYLEGLAGESWKELGRSGLPPSTGPSSS